MLTNTPPVLFNIPTPKTQCRSSPSALHAELLNTNHALHAFLLPTINHVYTVDGKKETLATLLQGLKKETWMKALSDEIGRLAQGNIHGVE